MIYNDWIYGEVDITEPVILEIINAKEMQRLKWVDQAWYFEPYFSWWAHSRFEHSVWVYLLLKIYWASLEEQIAWLIHDLSHWAFSHCLDYVFDEGDQKQHTHQDNIFEEFVKRSSIPEILSKYWINIEDVLNDKKHPLKEMDLPDLCADRIDYSLRTYFHYDKTPKNEIDKYLEKLKVVDNKWIFDNFEIAKQYAELFQRMNDFYYSWIESAVMFATVWDFLKYAWNMWYVNRDDFYTTDKEVLDKINKYLDSDERLKLLWDRMNNKIPFENNSSNFDKNLFCKNRIVNPLFIKDGRILRVSDRDPKWNEIVTNKNKPKEYFIKFER